MTARTKSKKEFFVALLIAAWAHVAIFFLFVILLIFDFLSAKVIPEDREKPKKVEEKVQISLVFEQDAPEMVDPLVPAPVAEEMPEPVANPSPPPPPPSGFVQTQADQETGEKPVETALIGEHDTTASSDAGAEAGEETMTALAGDEEIKQDVKTFDSEFANGANSGPQDGTAVAGDGGQGDAAMTQKEVEEMLNSDKPSEAPAVEVEPVKEVPEPKKDEIAEIDKALRNLEEALAEKEKPVQKVEESMPDKRAAKASEAANQDGGFAPKTNKTKVRGVINASGKGSLDVENTPAGRYEAQIYKLLERSWQMENISNRSLIAPGNITLYFVVERTGKVSNQQQISINGASATQWGMILRALRTIEIPKMPKEVIDDLDGDALELTVTFNY